jgi:putative sigma-54 modulation protein
MNCLILFNDCYAISVLTGNHDSRSISLVDNSSTLLSLEKRIVLISIHSHGIPLPAPLKTWIEDRLQAAVERLAHRSQRILVFLSDENGPDKSGLDKACRVVVQLDRQPSLVVADRDDDFAKVIDRIADRLSVAVSRRCERLRDRKHGRSMGS